MSAFGAVTGAGLLAPLTSLFACGPRADNPTGPGTGEPPGGAGPPLSRGFGPLSPRLPVNTGELSNTVIGDLRDRPLLALPQGFEYWVISPAGDQMTDGLTVPGDPDGMAAFRGEGNRIILVRNHELDHAGRDAGKPGILAPSGSMYDSVCRAGTTTLVLDEHGQLLEHHASLAGTFENCAGGPTPWGTWVSCEENTTVPPTSGVTQKHGYNFEVDPSHRGFVDPRPIIAMGRFNHEAVAVDPQTGWVYQTEDRDDSCFYRFRPHELGNLHSGGVLEALALAGTHQADTRTGFIGNLLRPLPVEWVPIDDVDPAGDTVRAEAQGKGAAVFARGEGAWFGNGKVYFSATRGGDAASGQVFAYDPVTNALTLFLEAVTEPSLGYVDPSWDAESVSANGGFVLAAPDNVTIAPDGTLYVCEDGNGMEKVVGVTPAGELFEVARNILNDSELCGTSFSPDGQFMFLNMQNPGLTLVIRGDWHRQQS